MENRMSLAWPWTASPRPRSSCLVLFCGYLQRYAL